MDEERFDAVVVGAGPAGSACAYLLAKEGKEVLLVERGDSAGQKNMTGGRLYTYALEELEAGLTKRVAEALERPVTHEQMMLLDGDRSVSIDFADESLAGDEDGDPVSYTIMRPVFDSWLAEEAENAGAMLACGVRVDSLVREGDRVVGIKAGDDCIFADVVIVADGINSLLAQSIGLVPELRVDGLCVGAKETVELPPDVIEQRFNCNPGEGAARLILGGVDGVNGGGIIYTNQSTISFGCVLMPAALADKHLSIADAVAKLKSHPSLAPLLANGKTVEYSAHLCGEAGLKAVSDRIGTEGLLVVGDAAGFCINQGYTVRGIDLAILSGVAAARAILEDGGSEACYRRHLSSTGVMRAMKMARKFPDVEDDPRIFSVYPELACNVFDAVYRINPSSSVTLAKKLRNCVKASTSYPKLFGDMRKVVAAINQKER